MENRKLLRTRLTVLLIAIIAVITASNCSAGQWILFSDTEIKGSVVDAETSKPIEGVIVVAMWRLSQIASQGFGGYAKIIEAVTDKNGKFMIPSWRTFKPWKFNSVMHELAPEIVIYKPGYKLYQSHKLKREGYPTDYSMPAEEKKRIKEETSLNPAKLKRIFTDEERFQNESDWGTLARFPNEYYSKEQTKTIFDALEEEISQVSNKNRDKETLLMSIRKMREFWTKDR